MGFPTEFPNLAVRQLGRVAMQKDTDRGRAALAVYDLIGFGLYKAFGDAKYLIDADLPELSAAIQACPPEVKPGLDWLLNQDTKTIPPIMIPLLMKAIEWLAAYIFERIKEKSGS